MLQKVHKQDPLYFPISPNCASAVPCKTVNMKIASFHINFVGRFSQQTHETH